MDLSVGRLQQLLTVARCGSFSKAAIELNVSQPTLSRSVAVMEARYGFKLFNRLGYGVEPTTAGAQVIARIQPLLQDLRVFEDNLHLFGSGKTGSLSIGLSPLFGSEILARFAAGFFSADAEKQLRVRIRSGGDLLEELRGNQIELLFFPEGHIEPDDAIEIVEIGASAPVCVVRRDHPLAGRDSPVLADLAAYPWAGSAELSLPNGLASRSRFICNNYHIIREAVLASDLISICSVAFVAGDLASGALHELKVRGLSLPRTAIYVAKLRGRVSSPLALDSIDRIAELLRHG